MPQETHSRRTKKWSKLHKTKRFIQMKIFFNFWRRKLIQKHHYKWMIRAYDTPLVKRRQEFVWHLLICSNQMRICNYSDFQIASILLFCCTIIWSSNPGCRLLFHLEINEFFNLAASPFSLPFPASTWHHS